MRPLREIIEQKPTTAPPVNIPVHHHPHHHHHCHHWNVCSCGYCYACKRYVLKAPHWQWNGYNWVNYPGHYSIRCSH